MHARTVNIAKLSTMLRVQQAVNFRLNRKLARIDTALVNSIISAKERQRLVDTKIGKNNNKFSL